MPRFGGALFSDSRQSFCFRADDIVDAGASAVKQAGEIVEHADELKHLDDATDAR